MPLPSGSRLGPYEVDALLGVGGMGEVYRARDTRLGRTVAIKILPAPLANTPGFRERFAREARAISAMARPVAASSWAMPGRTWPPMFQKFPPASTVAPCRAIAWT